MEGMSGGVLLIASEEGFDLKQGWKCRRVLVKCSNDPTAMSRLLQNYLLVLWNLL